VPTDGTTSTTSTSTATATSTTTTTTATEPAAHELAFAALVRDGNPFARDTVERLHAQQLAQQKALKAEQEHASLVTRSASASAPAAADTDVDEGSKLFITSTTINVAKFIGKYAQMMQTLEPIAFQIFLGIQQLFEFYVSGGGGEGGAAGRVVGLVCARPHVMSRSCTWSTSSSLQE
jgi:hypothetical protein